MKWLQKHISKRRRSSRSYRNYGTSIDNPDGELIYQDNGGTILFVGHLDTVKYSKRPTIDDTGCYDCPQLDDRLGVAMILERIASIVNEPFDVLLCDCEETGNSTSQYFVAPRQYRWACEFDRAGSDCVLYQYDDDTLQDSLERCGIEIGRGSFSDISSLDIGCQCVNWGCGYHGQHTNGCYCYASEVDSQLVKFGNWYRWFGAETYPYVPRPVVKRSWYDSWDSYVSRSRKIICDLCYCDANLQTDTRCIECGETLRKEWYHVT